MPFISPDSSGKPNNYFFNIVLLPQIKLRINGKPEKLYSPYKKAAVIITLVHADEISDCFRKPSLDDLPVNVATVIFYRFPDETSYNAIDEISANNIINKAISLNDFIEHICKNAGITGTEEKGYLEGKFIKYLLDQDYYNNVNLSYDVDDLDYSIV